MIHAFLFNGSLWCCDSCFRNIITELRNGGAFGDNRLFCRNCGLIFRLGGIGLCKYGQNNGHHRYLSVIAHKTTPFGLRPFRTGD